MARHSKLTNPDDLHYAKIRTFSGNVADFVPDFIDQLIAATDTNRVYRATGLAAGNLVELLPSVDGDGGSSKVRFFNGIAIAPDNLEQLLIDTTTNRVYRAIGLDVGDWLELIGGSDGQPPAISMGGGAPNIVPVKIGQLYFDFISRIQWVSVREGALNGWVEFSPIPQKLFASSSNSSSQTISQYFRVFYADITDPADIEAGDFTFTEKLGEVFISGQTEISDLVFPKGRGAIALVPQIEAIYPNLIQLDAEEFYTGSNYGSLFVIRETPFSLFANDGDGDFAIGKKYLWLSSYWWDTTGGFTGEIKFDMRINISDAP
ncbi:hypothetical protein [Pseudanabaena sp. BC1403]|uniref:hypothetical protein n=1 Tax=Pseudanabaena sp. BC1403 TaxID=2043171 RepID=UPI000CD86A99|nr:hypothetical protein [Pseudanabaena sp. BC1403]